MARAVRKSCITDETPNLKRPYIMAAQVQKHVMDNEAIRALDAVVQTGIIDRDLTTPPARPADGDGYIVAAGAGIALFSDGLFRPCRVRHHER